MKATAPTLLQGMRDVRLIELPAHARDDGEVIVAEGADVPFATVRMFIVRAAGAAERGNHAHRRCAQLMVCAHGAVDIVCDDGKEQRSFALHRGNLALFVPPTIWTIVRFRDAGALVVLCDRGYEAEDYIRDHSQFLAMRKTAR